MSTTHTRVPPADSPLQQVDDCPVRDVLDRVGDKWSVLLVTQLVAQPERFSALLRGTDGLSQRMLTRTLRLLERDGLVERDVAPTRPPQVTCSLTVLGRSLAQAIDPLTAWAVGHRAEIADARRAYDHSDAAADPTAAAGEGGGPLVADVGHRGRTRGDT